MQGGLTVDRGEDWLVRSRAEGGGTLRLRLTFEGFDAFVDELHPRGMTSVEGVGTSGLRRHPPVAFRIVVTWLILPVVICLSQRLSHACLSINKFVL